MSTLKSRGGGYFSPALCCLALALAAFLGLPGEAKANDGSGSEEDSVSAVLGEKPQRLDGVTVQVQNTQGPQLIVENTTDETLEVHDADGVPFLRIGPAGVEANRKAKTFYETYGPEGIIPPEEVRQNPGDAEADWQRVSDQRSWGWFDQRLETEDVVVPEEVSHGGQPAKFGNWEVPVKLGQDETELEGSYRYEPDPEGTYVASTTSEPQNQEIITQLSQGYGGATALLLQNEGEDPVTVLDGNGDPAIEIGPDEVRVNKSSPVGREASRGIGEESAETGSPQWQTVSGGSSFTWQDPRLRPPGGAEQPPGSNTSEPQEVAQWEIPLESSGESYKLEGVIEWQPLQSESTTGSGHDNSEDGHSQGEEETSPVSAATIVPVAGLLVAVSAGGALLYRRWRA